MKYSVQDIADALEQWAPADWAYDWDKVGLSIGDPNANVRRVLICLTVTTAALAAAKKANANMIVSHHPLIWEPLTTLRTDDPHTKLCLDCVAAKIACFAAHTNLDVAPGGVNHILANTLGITNLAPLFPIQRHPHLKLVTFVPDRHLARVRDAVCQAGAGGISNYTHCSFSAPGTGTFKPQGTANPYVGKKGSLHEEPEQRFETILPKSALPDVLQALLTTHPYEEVAYDIIPLQNTTPGLSLGLHGTLPKAVTLKTLTETVRQKLKLKHIRFVGRPTQRIRTLAVLGGSGGSEVPNIPHGIDAYLTGDIKYHDADTAQQRGLALIDAGHAATEKLIIPTIAHYLKKQLPTLKTTTYTEAELFQTLP